MPLPDGFHQIPGNRRLISAPDGTIISRAQAENLFAEQYGFRNDYELKSFARRVRSSRQYGYQERRAREYERERGFSRKEFRANAARLSKQHKEGRVDLTPGGTYALHMYYIGHADRTDIDYSGY